MIIEIIIALSLGLLAGTITGFQALNTSTKKSKAKKDTIRLKSKKPR